MKKLFKKIFTENKIISIITIILTIIAAWSDIFIWIVQKYILDNLVLWQNFNKIWILLLVLFISYAVTQIFWALMYYFSEKFWEKLSLNYKKRALEKINKINYKILLDKKQWELNNIISKWVSSLQRIIEVIFTQIIQNILMIFFGLVVIWFVDIYIFVYFICFFIPLFVWYSISQIKKRVPIAKNINDKVDTIWWEVVDYLSNIRDVKIFWVEKKFISNFKEKFLSIFSLNMLLCRHQHQMNFIQFMILIWSMCLVLAYTSYNISQWFFSIGTFILVYYIFWTIRSALWDLVFLYNRFEEDVIQINKFLDFFELEESNLKQDSFHWEFTKLTIKNLNFWYNDNVKILNNISFEIIKWEKIAIIWNSWQWKTTFISVILGLFEWYKWDILLNDKKIIWKTNNVFSYVPQETKMFNETIRFNLTLWEYFKDAKLIEILDQVGLTKLKSRIEKNKNILDIHIGADGLKLSGGEKQRLWIARAMIRKRDIYILDEITSNLDENTEKNILDLIFKITKNKTCIIITHKKEVLKKVDKIYEMSEWKLKNSQKENSLLIRD